MRVRKTGERDEREGVMEMERGIESQPLTFAVCNANVRVLGINNGTVNSFLALCRRGGRETLQTVYLIIGHQGDYACAPTELLVNNHGPGFVRIKQPQQA